MNKLDELKCRYVQTESDFIALTEVLPKNNRYPIDKAEIQLDGYEMFPENFPGNMRRGTVIYVKEELHAVELDLHTEFTECVFIKVDIEKSESLLIGCIYKSQSSDENNIRELNRLIRKVGEVGKDYSHIIIVGDFNYPNIDWNLCTGKDEVSENFMEAVADAFLIQMTKGNTRSRVDQNPTSIDLVLVNDQALLDEVSHSDPIVGSDHCVLEFNVQVVKEEHNQGMDTFRYNYKRADYAKLRESLSINWEEKLANKSCPDMVTELMEKLNENMDLHIPKTRTNLPKGKVPLSKQCVHAIQRKHRLWEKYIKNRTDDNFRNYAKARNKLKSILMKERKAKEKEIAKSAKTNVKSFWKYINSKKKTKSRISELMEGNIASSDKEKAEVLAKFFSSVFTTEENENYLMVNKSEEQSDDSKFTREEVNKLLKELDVTKSPGPDNIHPRVLYELADVIDLPLTIIFNESFKSGLLPDIWKIAQITVL
ncbi:hypothetical protein FSP39_013056 [Pinctada imbricata]|uniref:Endonuclease/exonuclease/phosphatase domain-containing protein n=1 Tax=Pinctada imbricata TaxID=66713 RepID=A0AA88YIX4_PINIB|nr:hypothetical protein FSP39_013056 [Pinctada imbricata]